MPKPTLQQRVVAAAEQCLQTDKSVGILEVFMNLGFLHTKAYDTWKRGIDTSPLEDRIQVGSEKWKKSIQHFLSWVQEQRLEPFEVTFESNSARGTRPLRLTAIGDESSEALYRTKYRRADLTSAQKKRLEEKANKPAELLVYVPTGQASDCVECQATLDDLLYLENGNALCLACADFDHLEFLPSGNATLTRRAKKLSPLSAIVVKFNRRRKRYERQGILVTRDAIQQAEESCEADADQRAQQRVKAAERRIALDAKLVEEMTDRIMQTYPACPREEAQQMAEHTAERGSGRVGRSAAGRSLSQKAIDLAVGAWIRHQHTNYDTLLMRGVERLHAREQIAAAVDDKRHEWQQH